MGITDNIRLVHAIFAAIERRDALQFQELVQANWHQEWPPSLPYGRTSGEDTGARPTWEAIWFPLQPTEAERRMDPEVVAASADTVVVHWHQRGKTLSGERFEGEVLALYRIHDGKLAHAHMFPFDTAATVAFLAQAHGREVP